MLVAMTHEMHGTHIAYTDLEVVECEKNGWKRDKALSDELAGRAPAAPVFPQATEVKRGPGRPKKDE